MHQCCTEPYDKEFGQDQAQTDLQDYKSVGPKKSTRPLLNILVTLDLKGESLLDIGGGIGAVVFELFKKGIQSAQHVDISRAYVQIFRDEAADRSLANRITSEQGDFVDIHAKIDRAGVVVLDKVICCYPEYNDLVRYSVQKATKWYAIVIPRDLWWVKVGQYIESLWRRMKGKNFKTHIHPVSKIEQIINEDGMRLYRSSVDREWYYALYHR